MKLIILKAATTGVPLHVDAAYAQHTALHMQLHAALSRHPMARGRGKKMLPN
eukprot:COSAG06_NODE_573_length_14086_cov_30.835633_10_plen_52_part_00